ncbi:hypothetical protein [Planococcus faecalis]|uniref:Uncharacterized protein n=1 Tax=Planococcus faecalis TaxID=1598147 RepID=A0ABN4XFP6_9BACL|nr:hypothetical protein [Planococcus faecalis]AQU78446.1 hypothetical protein AJGP001_03650 [Planococcus faecalis]OHX52363.1 hypothetical protein BB777_11965 [Planococcus faecalis]
MLTNEMMLHRMFVRYCNTHVVTRVSYLSKSSKITLESTFENYLSVKVGKLKSIENFIMVVEQRGIMKMAYKITAPVKINIKNQDTHFLLESIDGQLKIVFSNS